LNCFGGKNGLFCLQFWLIFRQIAFGGVFIVGWPYIGVQYPIPA